MYKFFLSLLFTLSLVYAADNLKIIESTEKKLCQLSSSYELKKENFAKALIPDLMCNSQILVYQSEVVKVLRAIGWVECNAIRPEIIQAYLEGADVLGIFEKDIENYKKRKQLECQIAVNFFKEALHDPFFVILDKKSKKILLKYDLIDKDGKISSEVRSAYNFQNVNAQKDFWSISFSPRTSSPKFSKRMTKLTNISNK